MNSSLNRVSVNVLLVKTADACPLLYSPQTGEILLQFHVVTDGHEQMRKPIQAFLNTVRAYRQQPLTLLTTDNPRSDATFFKEVMSSLQDSQIDMDVSSTKSSPPAMPVSPPPPPPGPVPLSDNLQQVSSTYLCLSGKSVMDVNLKAVKNVALSLPKTERTISVDTEWDTNKSTRGMSRGPDRIGTVQIGYRQISNGTVHALILQVSGWGPQIVFQ